ncbi:MFS transporter [Cupriavidus plantarum]|uniref:MFS transporter n=1 Tax=Cupriavidus plantarum TaxID=942865 RepID=UPI001B1BD146|nr:MFS transporter [Cupriavidus plantarum]CAG2147500.1 Purine ribonucleoside efflux pump NepI [Cupriavidus plantarum]SMR85545.1 Predicted arabinose efflux permease, MFS family [Cupriavidus plantarum]
MDNDSGATTLGIRHGGAANRLPLSALLALAMTSFIATANETVPAGLLPDIASGYHMSEAWAGQLVTSCALGSGLAAIPLTAMVRRWKRRTVLLLVLAAFLVCNAITAVSTSFVLTLATRFAVGLATGLAWCQLASYARRIAPASMQGRALAIAMIGIPLALSVGVPLSVGISRAIGWRSIFGIMSAMSLALMAWVCWKVPDYPGKRAGHRFPMRQVLVMEGVRPVLCVVMAWILPHYILYTYIAPYLASVGLAHDVEAVLLIFGVFSVIGIWVTGCLVDVWLRQLILLGIGAFAVASVVLGLYAKTYAITSVGVAIWGFTFGGAPTLLQTALADAAGEGAELAQSALVTAFNLSFACSGIVGGILLETAGVASIPWVVASLLMIGMTAAWRAKAHGFPSMGRQYERQAD